MKTNYVVSILAYPFTERFAIKVTRIVKNSKPRKEIAHIYNFDYSSEHIHTAMKRFSEMIRINNENIVKYMRNLSKNEKQN